MLGCFDCKWLDPAWKYDPLVPHCLFDNKPIFTPRAERKCSRFEPVKEEEE